VSFTLFICALPIGHLGDITWRVKTALKDTPIIFCEDTRVTKSCLMDHGIWADQRLVRMDQYQEKHAIHLFDQFILNQNVAYVSDAGTPTISDPGALLVAHARHLSVPVVVLPGASALTAFMAGAGILCASFYFGGFLSKKSGDRDAALQSIVDQKLVGIWFESPKRILATILAIQSIDPLLPVVVAKEITKSHERFFSGSVADVYNALSVHNLRGEWVFLVDARNHQSDTMMDYHQRALQLKGMALSGKQVKQLAPLLNMNKNKLYEMFQEL
jgi:16S rRNA (cytidine1402-2'-O)-methyltransferase